MVEKRVDDMEEYRDYPISCVVPIDIDGITCITGRPLCDTKKLEPGTIDRENEKSKMNKSALVVEGGGMRGVFSAGVLHAFGEIGFNPFDLYIGVSAGACNLASHLAGQNDRNFDIIMRYSSTRRFINPLRFFRGGHYMDLDWLWDITIREYRLDLKTLFGSLARDSKEFIVVTTSMNTGRALYLQPDEVTLEEYLKASSSLPILYRKILKIDGEAVTDGGIADPVPVIEAYRRGARIITVIRSRPAGYIKKKERFGSLVSRYMKQYPGFMEAFRRRHAAYMEAVDFINNPPDGVVVHEITPDSTVAMSRASKDKKSLSAAYCAGMKEGWKFFEKGNRGMPALQHGVIPGR